MKIVKYLLFIILIAVICLAVYIAVQPGTYHITRTHEINAPAPVVHNYIDDYKKWNEWSPWKEYDPGAAITYGDKTTGVGASYAWKGEELGEGDMETTYVSQDSIHQVLNFKSPRESTADVYWTIDEAGETTKVTWGMKGEMGFMEKAYMTFNGGMDKMIGPDYERGLKKLDSTVTTGVKKYSVTDNGISEHGGGYYMYITTSGKQSETTAKVAKMFPEVRNFMQENSISSSGKPFVLYEKWDDANGTAIFSTCIPVKEKVITLEGSEVICGYIAPGAYYKTTLKGNYTNLEEAWNKATQNMQAKGYKASEVLAPFEVYVNDVEQTPNPANLVTEIYIPVKTPEAQTAI